LQCRCRSEREIRGSGCGASLEAPWCSARESSGGVGLGMQRYSVTLADAVASCAPKPPDGQLAGEGDLVVSAAGVALSSAKNLSGSSARTESTKSLEDRFFELVLVKPSGNSRAEQGVRLLSDRRDKTSVAPPSQCTSGAALSRPLPVTRPRGLTQSARALGRSYVPGRDTAAWAAGPVAAPPGLPFRSPKRPVSSWSDSCKFAP